jgi:hypothetical protein
VTVVRLVRGQQVSVEVDPGLHNVRCRLALFRSDDLPVDVTPERDTYVSFGIDKLSDGIFGWRALRRRTRGRWGATVDSRATGFGEPHP